MHITILGKRWNLIFPSNFSDDGRCDPPDSKNKCIRVAQRLKGRERLDTIIHELMHAANWHLDEDFVNQCSTDIARILWKLGYRPTNENE